MKKIILFVIVILIIIPLFSKTIWEKKFDVKLGQELNVNLKSGGSIDISGWKQRVVEVRVYCRNGSAAEWNIKHDQTEKGIEITANYLRNKKNGNLEFKILVPLKFDLKLKTMGGGISLKNVDGNIRGRTMGGSLELSYLKGEVHLRTMGGSITLRDSDIDGLVKTMGGRVLLENVVGDIKGSSMGGNVVYRNVKSRKGKSTGKVVKITTMGGSINVENASEGADVHTMGGKIHIKSAAMFVKAKTMGGKIKIDGINGEVEATTMGGNIDVTMIGNPAKGKRDVTLTSMKGDITLAVPKKLSMDIDIELAYTKRSQKKYKIVSDFKINVQESEKWEDSNGSLRKYIYGKGKIRNGKHKIKIKTINGNIYLKKNK